MSDGNDTINGDGADNTFDGGLGDDVVYGAGGDDDIRGGLGNDLLYGGDGDDLVRFDEGVDEYYGGDGIDTLSAEDFIIGPPSVSGGVYIDLRLSRADKAYGGDGVSLVSGFENIIGSTAADFLRGDAGDNLFIGGPGEFGADQINGGGGDDTVSYAHVTVDLVINLHQGHTYGLLYEDIVDGVANAIGGSGNDRLFGDSFYLGTPLIDNLLDGGLGADVMKGMTGDDTYVTDNVGDVIYEAVGEGTDTVRTTLSSYTLIHDLENLVYVGGGDFAGTGNKLANVLTGGEGDDVLNGLTGADSHYGGLGDDTYHVDNFGDVVAEAAGEGHDTVVARVDFVLGAGIAVEVLQAGRSVGISLTGNELSQDLIGGAGINQLDGRGGDDRIYGGAGKDLLFGGQGADSLYGGAGVDRFIFSGLADFAGDQIFDFSTAEHDLIVLTTLDADTNTGADDAFSFIGGAAFSGAAGELRYAATVGGVEVAGDVDGDGAADFSLIVLGVASLAASDFTL